MLRIFPINYDNPQIVLLRRKENPISKKTCATLINSVPTQNFKSDAENCKGADETSVSELHIN